MAALLKYTLKIVYLFITFLIYPMSQIDCFPGLIYLIFTFARDLMHYQTSARNWALFS